MPDEDALSFIAVEDVVEAEEGAVVGVEVAEDERDIVDKVSKFHGPAVKSAAGW